MLRYLFHGAWLWWHQRRQLHYRELAECHARAYNYHANKASRPSLNRRRVSTAGRHR